MITDLEPLRESVRGLTSVHHPWVRNLSREDRIIVYLDETGFPESISLVTATDAKQLVTIAKDNHNSFPAFRLKNRQLGRLKKFCTDLREIYTEGPMAGLLAAVGSIKDEEKWFALFDKLVARADISEESKKIGALAFDLVDKSVLHPTMRSVLSESLFKYEENNATSDRKMPNPNLPVLGLSYLMSKNPDVPSFRRYGMEGLDSFSLDRQSGREIAAALEWITQPSHKSKTWQSVPGATNDKRDLLIVYLSTDPNSRVQFAEFFGDVELESEPSEREEQEAFYASLCESITAFFSHRTGPAVRNEFLELLLLRKISPGVTRVETHLQPSIEQVKRSIGDWNEALGNVPRASVKPRFLAPGQLVRTLQKQWIRGGKDFVSARFELRAIYDLLFRTPQFNSAAAMTIEAAYKRAKSLLLSGSRSQAAGHCFTAVGIALFYRGYQKEVYMEGKAYKMGEFLAMADLVHKCYCQEVRDGAMPLSLIGNAHFDMASSQPASALALMQSRLKLYVGWAQVRGGGLARWAVKKLGEISGSFAGELPSKFSTDEKAQMLLGYLARSKGESVLEQEEKNAND